MAAVATPLVDTSTTHTPTTVSVVICGSTVRQWDDIVRSVEALTHQTRRPDQIVIVVDHDDELLQRAADHFAADGGRGDSDPIAIDVVANTRARGVRGARNAGLSWSHGDVIAFLSDDARPVDVYWLATMMEDYTAPDVAGVGGSATPDWGDAEPPSWFPSEFGWIVGCTHAGAPSDVADVEDLIGCNMSFRREVFDELAGFGDASSEFCDRLRRRFPKARLVFDPDLGVSHRVDADPVDFAAFRSCCWQQGRSAMGIAADGDYLRTVLPRGMVRGLADGLRGRRGGFRRAGAIAVGGVLLTGGRARSRVTAGTSKLGFGIHAQR